MEATQITNHVDAALARLLEQYKQATKMQDLISAIVEQIQDVEDATFALNTGRMLYNGSTFPSSGAQLDGIGELVDFARNGLDDDTYLIFILGTIAQNHSNGTIPSLLDIIYSLFQAPEGFLFYEIYPAAIAVAFSSTQVDPSLFATISDMIQNSLGAGIGLSYILQYDADNPFAFTDLTGTFPDFPNGNGFDNLLSPGQGGVFATLIYANPDT